MGSLMSYTVNTFFLCFCQDQNFGPDLGRFWSCINIWSWAEVVFNRSWFRHDSRGLELFFFVKVLFLHIFILPFYFFQENMSYSFDVTRMWMVQRTKNSMTIAGSALFILMYFTSPIHGAGGDCMCKYHWFYISNICTGNTSTCRFYLHIENSKVCKPSILE